MQNKSVGLTALLVFGLVACSGQGSNQPKPASDMKANLAVEIIYPKLQEWVTGETVTGIIAPRQDIAIGPDIAGYRVLDTFVEVGQVVKKGTVLASLNIESLVLEAKQVQSTINEAEALAKQAEANWERGKALDVEDAISKQELLSLETSFKSTNAKVGTLKTQLDILKLKISYGDIKAPFDGIISVKNVVAGQVAQAGSELFRLIRESELEWRAEVPVAKVGTMEVGNPVQITLNGKPVVGQVRAISPSTDTATRSKLVYASLSLPYSAGAVGIPVQGQIVQGSSPLLTIPSTLVLASGGGHIVQAVKEGKVVSKQIKIGGKRDGQVAVVEGLSESDALVKEGSRFLKDGDPVRMASTLKSSKE